jgi:hypothetical protein
MLLKKSSQVAQFLFAAKINRIHSILESDFQQSSTATQKSIGTLFWERFITIESNRKRLISRIDYGPNSIKKNYQIGDDLSIFSSEKPLEFKRDF